MITVYTFGANHWPTPDPGPFCSKLLAYLTLAQIPFERQSGFEHIRKAPKGKMPYVEIDGEKIGDSSLIIERLKQQFGDPLGDGLSAEQKAITRAVGKMLDENTYWTIVYTRWAEKDNWEGHTKPTFFGAMNPLMRAIVPRILRRGVIKQLSGHGIGRHLREEIYNIGIADLRSLADLLGDQQYFFGDKPRELDAYAYAFLSAIIGVPHASPLRDFADSHPTLKPYFERLDQQLRPAT